MINDDIEVFYILSNNKALQLFRMDLKDQSTLDQLNLKNTAIFLTSTLWKKNISGW